MSLPRKKPSVLSQSITEMRAGLELSENDVYVKLDAAYKKDLGVDPATNLSPLYFAVTLNNFYAVKWALEKNKREHPSLSIVDEGGPNTPLALCLTHSDDNEPEPAEPNVIPRRKIIQILLEYKAKHIPDTAVKHGNLFYLANYFDEIFLSLHNQHGRNDFQEQDALFERLLNLAVNNHRFKIIELLLQIAKKHGRTYDHQCDIFMVSLYEVDHSLFVSTKEAFFNAGYRFSAKTLAHALEFGGLPIVKYLLEHHDLKAFPDNIEFVISQKKPQMLSLLLFHLADENFIQDGALFLKAMKTNDFDLIDAFLLKKAPPPPLADIQELPNNITRSFCIAYRMIVDEALNVNPENHARILFNFLDKLRAYSPDLLNLWERRARQYPYYHQIVNLLQPAPMQAANHIEGQMNLAPASPAPELIAEQIEGEGEMLDPPPPYVEDQRRLEGEQSPQYPVVLAPASPAEGRFNVGAVAHHGAHAAAAASALFSPARNGMRAPDVQAKFATLLDLAKDMDFPITSQLRQLMLDEAQQNLVMNGSPKAKF